VICSSIFLTSTFGPPNFPPESGLNQLILSKRCSWVFRPSARWKNRIVRLNGNVFFDFFRNFLKRLYGNFTNMNFSQIFQM